MPASVNTAGNVAAWQRYAATAAAAETAARGCAAAASGMDPGARSRPGRRDPRPLSGRRVLELGCGTGTSAALLVSRGAQVTALDAAEAQIRRAHTRWAQHPNLAFVCAEAHNYLAGAGAKHDIVLSIFGALDFAPPARLPPRSIAALRPGGMLAMSTVHPEWSPPQHLHTETGPAVPVT